MEDMLKDPKVELVVVVTPASSHADLCIQTLNAGKNGEWFRYTADPQSLSRNRLPRRVQKPTPCSLRETRAAS